MKMICDCGAELENASEGKNGGNHYECRCGLCFDILYSIVEQPLEEN
jgi:hypothetical protein